MMRYSPGVIGLLLFALFAGYLAININAPPLQIIIIAVVVMAVMDYVLQAKRGEL